MNAEEFIEQYGKIEMIKMMKYEENKSIQDNIALGSESSRKQMSTRNSMRPNTSMTLGNDIKEKMR